ncbi:NUDIX domain-containing protein [Paraflavitalea sp. CAU 1676]|uniref:NUDIX hydrolase n=1 Tax=Paraflavitalea sp. CAU 1676 TaxID=3032598 RepID=UPI0023DB82E5|nr:NUDIX domain-containing protein [Paraflavitalea sp. CAU 1676]MDF2190080.1 NUDIX domain-containing protein [Paraflavitalea sp. CAU 1676]
MAQPITTTQLQTVGLLIIRNRQLLLAFSNNKQCFYLPGGKVDAGETPQQALCREIAEELNIQLTPADLVFYTHTTAPAYGERTGIIMEQDCYFVNRPVEPVASAEIGKIAYFTIDTYLLEENRAPGAVMVLEQLKQDGFID